MRPAHVPLWAIYLLHFDQPVDGRSHYVGRCEADRLQQRMIEHTTGRGAKLTRRACEQGTAWALARVTHAINGDHEAVLDAVKDQPGICPFCQGVPAIRTYQPTKNAGHRMTGVSENQRRFAAGLAQLPSSGHEKSRTSKGNRPFPDLRGGL